MWPGCGASTRTRCPGPGCSAYELLDALGADIRSLLLMGSNPVVSAPRAAHVEQRLRVAGLPGGRGRGAVRDGRARRRRPAGDPVGGGDRHDDQPGGAGAAAPAGGRLPRTGSAAICTCCIELAARAGVEKGFPVDPEEVFEELRRASAGGIADYSGITYRRLAEENGVFWPCPAQDDRQDEQPTARSPARASRFPPSLPRPVRDRGRAGPVRARDAPADRRGAGRRVPGAADHRAGRGPVPVRGPDAAGRRAERRRARAVRGAAPPAGRAAGGRGGRRRSPSCRGAGGRSRRRGSPPRSAPTPSSCPSTGRARAGPTR